MSDLVGTILNNHLRIEEAEVKFERGYKALDIDQNKHFLIKFLPSNLVNDKIFLKYFLNDTRKAAALAHPNLHGLYGADFQNGFVYLVFDYINALTLAEVLENTDQKLSKNQIAQIFLAVSEVLHYLHENGYVYQDLRPQNILMEKNGRLLLKNTGFLMLEGFSESRNYKFISPIYLSPEQIEGFESTPSSNIYSLGVLLYEMLTYGKLPFTGERVIDHGSKIEKIIREKATMEPISPGQYNPEISPALEIVLIKSLSKNPEKRFRSILEFKYAFLDVYL